MSAQENVADPENPDEESRDATEKASTSTLAKVLGITAILIGGAIGTAAAQSLSIQTIARFVGGGVAGALCGLLPYYIGRKKDPKLARIALWSCAGAGLILGIILALPTAIVFAIVIARK